MRSRALVLVLRVTTLVSRFGLSLLVAREFSLLEAGSFALYAAGVSLAFSLIGCDTYLYVTREILSGRGVVAESLSRHAGAIVALAGIGTPIAVALILSQPVILVGGAAGLFGHVVLEFVGHEVGRVQTAVGMPIVSSVMTFVRTSLWAVVGIASYAVDAALFSPRGLIAWWMAASAIAVSIGLWSLNHRHPGSCVPHFDLRWMQLASRSAAILFVGSLLLRVVLGGDRFVVERYLGLEQAGLYAVYATFAFALISVVEAGVNAFRYPAFVSAVASGDRVAERKSFNRFRRESVVTALLAGCGAAVTVPALLRRFGQEQYTTEFAVFYVITAAAVVYCISSPYHFTLFALGRDRLLLLANAAGAAVLLVAGPVLMGRFGLGGAAWTVFGALAAVAVLRAMFAQTVVRE